MLKIVKEVEIKKEKDEEKGGAVVKRKNKKEAEIDELEHIGHTEEVDPVWVSSRIKSCLLLEESQFKLYQYFYPHSAL